MRYSAKKFRTFLKKKIFAECLQAGHSAKKLIFLFKKFFAECSAGGHSAKLGITLCRVSSLDALGKENIFF